MSLKLSSSQSEVISSKQLKELQHINLQLAALGQPICNLELEHDYLQVADGLLKNYIHDLSVSGNLSKGNIKDGLYEQKKILHEIKKTRNINVI